VVDDGYNNVSEARSVLSANSDELSNKRRRPELVFTVAPVNQSKRCRANHQVHLAG
jgi:hypothetical protein